MSKHRTPLILLLVLLLTLQACNFPSGDAVQETQPPGEAPPEPAETEAPDVDEPPAPLGPIDCGEDLGCFSAAGENCTPAIVLFSIPLDMFGVLITTTTYQEILGMEEGMCVFRIRTENVTVEYGEEAIQQLRDSGLTDEQIEEQRVMVEQQANQEKMDEICRVDTETFTALMDQWAEGSYSTEDWEGLECEGEVFGE